ncbi:MAG TPA: thioredoxin domain-containing protein [Terriglobales bacterium]|nr:thioredoxin domain-containing protein [Terriglobales bacterium]
MNCFTRVLLTAGLCIASMICFAQNTREGKAVASTKATTSSTTGTPLPTEATVNAFLKSMFGWNPELSWKVVEIKPSEAPGIAQVTAVFNTPKGSQVVRIYVTPDQKYAFMAELVPFGAHPFAETKEMLKAASGPSEGPLNAPVTIVEFGDLECPACKAAQASIAQLLQEEPKVRLIFQNYPLDQIHPWALTAAKYVDCLTRENNQAAVKFIATTYEHQEEINPQNVEQMLQGFVKESGGNPDAVAACAAKPETNQRVQESVALGQKLDVTSTPTFFINGRRMVGFSPTRTPLEAVKAMVDYDLANPD